MMNTQEKLQALRYLVPGCQYAARGDVIEWLDERPMPTEREIEAALPEALRAEEMAVAEQEKEALITAKMREMAEAELIKEGKLEA